MVTQLPKLDRKANSAYRLVLYGPSACLFFAILVAVLIKKDHQVLRAWTSTLGVFAALISFAFVMRGIFSNSTWLKCGTAIGVLTGMVCSNPLIYIVRGHSFEDLLVQIFVQWILSLVILTVYMVVRKEPSG